MSRLMTIAEVSSQLALKPSTIRKMIFQKRISVVRIGRSVRIKEEDVEKMVVNGYHPGILDGSAAVDGS